jgi:hypothetical protein
LEVRAVLAASVGQVVPEAQAASVAWVDRVVLGAWAAPVVQVA